MHSLAHNKKTTGLAEHLTGLLSDPQPLVRITAARLLAQVDKKRAVTALTEALPKEESPHVKKEMLQSLGATGDRSVAGTLLAALADGRAHPMVRGGAALGLGELGSDEPKILEALLILNPDVERDFGLRALMYLGTDAAAETLANSPLLGDRFGFYRSLTSVGALTTFPGPKVSRRLTELAKRDYAAGNELFHPYLVYALARRPDSAATEGLRDIAKNHKDEKIRLLAAKLLGGKPSAQPGP
jgi:HEAT repeat protein